MAQKPKKNDGRPMAVRTKFAKPLPRAGANMMQYQRMGKMMGTGTNISAPKKASNKKKKHMKRPIPVVADKTKGTNLKKQLEAEQLPPTDGVNGVEGTKKRLAAWREKFPIKKQAWTKQ